MTEVNRNLSNQIFNAMLETIQDLHSHGGATDQQLLEMSQLCSDAKSTRPAESVGSDEAAD